jgi:hypothetical protein
MNVLDLYAKLIPKFSLKDVSSPRAVASSDLPFLLIYGTDDKAVPYEMGVTISKASERTKLISIEGAHHLCCCIQDPERYKNEVCAFLEEKWEKQSRRNKEQNVYDCILRRGRRKFTKKICNSFGKIILLQSDNRVCNRKPHIAFQSDDPDETQKVQYEG